MKTLYYSLIHSHLSYGTMLWGSAFQYSYVNWKLFRRKLSVIYVMLVTMHTSPLFKQLSIPKLNDIHNTQLCKLMFLFTNGTLPCPLQMVFTRNSNVHSYQTRQAHDPHFVARKSSFISKNCMYQAPVAWSNLPLATKSCKSVKSFNYQVKNTILILIDNLGSLSYNYLSPRYCRPYKSNMLYIAACYVPV